MGSSIMFIFVKQLIKIALFIHICVLSELLVILWTVCADGTLFQHTVGMHGIPGQRSGPTEHSSMKSHSSWNIIFSLGTCWWHLWNKCSARSRKCFYSRNLRFHVRGDWGVLWYESLTSYKLACSCIHKKRYKICHCGSTFFKKYNFVPCLPINMHISAYYYLKIFKSRLY